MAGAIALASVLASIVFFALDKTVAGGIMLSLPVTTMIRSFLHRRPSDD